MSFEMKCTRVCRTCLAESETMRSVFSVEEIMEQVVPLCDVLMSCTSVQVMKGDGLPEQVCLECVKEMNKAFVFRKLCEKSDATLRTWARTFIPLPVNSNELEAYFMNKDGKGEAYKTDILNLKGDAHEWSEDIKNSVYNNAKLDTIDDTSCHDDSFEESESDGSYGQKKKVKKKTRENEQKKTTYKCKECETLCLHLRDYRQHMTKMHSHIYKCNTCNKEFKSETILTRHLLSHNQITENELQMKSKQSRNKTGITKKRNLPRTCNICNKTFRFHSNLERHKLIHTGEKPYLCNVCGKGFAQLSYLKIHSFIHTGEKPYKCKMCEKSFAAPGTLMTHIRTHTGERPYICKICGKNFPQSGYLSAHIRTHTGEKPVECKVCHRRFNQSGRLIIHMRIHSGEKPYNCVECGRSFAVKATLKKHIRTHTGERPYVCIVCGQAFAQSGTLATHMKIHKPK